MKHQGVNPKVYRNRVVDLNLDIALERLHLDLVGGDGKVEIQGLRQHFLLNVRRGGTRHSSLNRKLTYIVFQFVIVDVDGNCSDGHVNQHRDRRQGQDTSQLR